MSWKKILYVECRKLSTSNLSTSKQVQSDYIYLDIHNYIYMYNYFWEKICTLSPATTPQNNKKIDV